MQRLALTALILLAGCEPAKPNYKYELGAKVLLKAGVEAVITFRSKYTREGHPEYAVTVTCGAPAADSGWLSFAPAQEVDIFIVHELEIEKKIR